MLNALHHLRWKQGQAIRKKTKMEQKEKGKGRVSDSNFEGEDSRVLEH
jgi:hypothetical protein